MNRVIPEDAGGFLEDKLKEQSRYMQKIHEAFDPMRIMTCPMMKTELRGLEKLELMADLIYGDDDPYRVYSDGSPMSFETVDGVDCLYMKMPFVSTSDVELFRIDPTTLMIHVGSQKRNIQLPDTLISAELLGAEFKDDKLVIRFRR